MTDGALDLMEWLRFLRKVKFEKYTVAETFFDFMTEAQWIKVTRRRLDPKSFPRKSRVAVSSSLLGEFAA